jgi:hypothetical protein
VLSRSTAQTKALTGSVRFAKAMTADLPSNAMGAGIVEFQVQGLGIVITNPLVTAIGSNLDGLCLVQSGHGVVGWVCKKRHNLGVRQNADGSSTWASIICSHLSKM